MATENDPCFQVHLPPAVLKGTTETELNELRVDPNSVQETGTELGEELSGTGNETRSIRSKLTLRLRGPVWPTYLKIH